MEAHAGAITSTGRVAPAEHPRIAGKRVKLREGRLVRLRAGIRRRRRQRAERAYSMSTNGPHTQAVLGSEHTHVFIRPRGF